MYENRQQQSSGAGGFVAGVICGAAIGAAVGLLMATKPGEELRGQIAESARRFRSKASDAYDAATDKVSETMNRGRDALRRGQDEFREFVADDSRRTTESGNAF